MANDRIQMKKRAAEQRQARAPVSRDGSRKSGTNSATRAQARPSRLGRRPRVEHENTRDQILDVAEELFAKHGYYAVTIKQVAREAAVDTALLHYYFQNKRGLFDQVFGRRAEIANKTRMESLEEYQRTTAGRMTVEGVVDAFVRPLIQLAADGGPGWKNYFALVAQVNNTPEWGGATMTRYFDPVIHRFIELMQAVMPDASEEDLYWCFQLFTGAITLSMSRTGRIDRLSGGICRSSDLKAVFARMVPYTSGGFRMVCEAAKARRRRQPTNGAARKTLAS